MIHVIQGCQIINRKMSEKDRDVFFGKYRYRYRMFSELKLIKMTEGAKNKIADFYFLKPQRMQQIPVKPAPGSETLLTACWELNCLPSFLSGMIRIQML
jgi:hypothetical protein